MKKFRKIPVVIEAGQWFKDGDHPAVEPLVRQTSVPLHAECERCGHLFNEHGWIPTLKGGLIVCPTDWIIKGVEGEFYPCKYRIFVQTYEEVPTWR